MKPPPAQPVAIVTGASTGIGRAIALALAREGYALAIMARGEERLMETAQAIVDETDAPVLPITADAGSPADMEQLVEATIEQFGRLDVLVNNAGAAKILPVEDSDSVAFLESYVVNVFGPAAAIRAAWPTFKAQGRGRVINISSWAARDPFPGFFVYGSSKAALNGLTRSINNDGREHGIRAFAICPGAVETDMLRAAFDESFVPPEKCLAPSDIAALAIACLRGEYDDAPNSDLYIRRADDGSVLIEVPDTIPR